MKLHIFFAAAVFFSLKAADNTPIQVSAEEKEEAARKRVYEIVCWNEQQDRQYQRKTRCGCTYNEQQLCDPYMHYLTWRGPIGDMHADTQVAKDIEDAVGCPWKSMWCLSVIGLGGGFIPQILVVKGIMAAGVANVVSGVSMGTFLTGAVFTRYHGIRLSSKWEMQRIAREYAQAHNVPTPESFPHLLGKPGVVVMGDSNRLVPAPAPGARRRHGASPSDAQPLLDASGGYEGQTQ